MKKIFFIMLSLAMLSLSATSLSARGMMGGGMGNGDCGGQGMGMHKPFMHLDMLQYQFDLTNAQVDKIYKIDKDYMDKFYQNRNNADKIKELREKHSAEIESILTPEQKVKWNDFRMNHPMKGRGNKNENGQGYGPMGGMNGHRLEMLQKDLGLSNEQVDKIYKIHRDSMDKFYQNRNDGDKVRELREKEFTEIESVLTAEQKAKWNEYKKNRPMRGNKSGEGNGWKGHRGMMYDDYDEK